MDIRRTLSVLVVVVALSLLAGSCGGGAASDVAQRPGEGVTVTMARANWSTGYFQAEVYRQLLGELGYAVNDPATLELSPSVFYPDLARGDIDFWVNGWFPLHDEFMMQELEDGSLLSDHVVALGTEIAGGGLQGVLVDSATATAASITWLGDIGDSPQTAALFDTDGDGLANLVGCNDGWGCQTALDEIIEENGWSDTIEQDSEEYDELWAEAMTRLEAGEPTLAYTWTPSGYVGEMTPGDGAVWLSVSDGDAGDGAGGVLPPNECPGQPCDLGFAIADIRVVANLEFAVANPVLELLFQFVGFQLRDIVLQNLQMRRGESSPADIERHATEWIEQERRTIDAWLREARAAAG
jgi:glycine betaine/proline transport system substrate-binding protein